MKKLIAFAALAFLIGIAFTACDETTTDPEPGDLPASGTVTFDIAVPFYDETGGKQFQASIWSDWDSETPLFTESGTISATSLSFDIADVDTGIYAVSVSIDIAEDGFGEGDLVWAAIDVPVDGDETITITQYGWQYVEDNVIAFGVRGIPEGNHGEIFALGIFEDGADIFADSLETIYGGVGLVYGTSAVVFTTEDVSEGDSTGYELPTGNYDVYMLVDLDGSMEDWFAMEGGPIGNPITNGDYIASYNLVYDALTDDYGFLISPTFEEVQAFTLTLNLTAPEYESLEGNSVLTVLFSDFDNENPITADSTVVSSGTATSTLTVLAAGIYSFAAVIDVTGNGFGSLEDPPVDAGDLVWGAVDISINADKTVNITADAWQYYHSIIVAVNNVPSGHDGEVFAVGMFPSGENPFTPQLVQEAEMVGVGLIYENSAFIALWPGDDGGGSWLLPEGDYDIWCLIDVNGTLTDYDRPENDSSAWNPTSIDDWYLEYEFSYDTSYYSEDEFILIDQGTFAQIVGIRGTITCPSWTSSGGNIYVYLFSDNPLMADSSDAYSLGVLEQPGAYGLPCFPGDSVIVAGFWDVDNSGDWDGPDHGVDIVGGYGPALDSLEYVTCLAAGVSNIDFELDTVYDSTQYGP